jgi:hypothetical protein
MHGGANLQPAERICANPVKTCKRFEAALLECAQRRVAKSSGEMGTGRTAPPNA